MAAMQRFVETQPKWVIASIGLVIVALIGIIDFLTGDYSLLIFYFIPVSFVSWFAGRWAGSLIAVFSGCARLISDLSLAIDGRHLYWNSFQDMIFLLIVGFLVALLRQALTNDRSPAP